MPEVVITRPANNANWLNEPIFGMNVSMENTICFGFPKANQANPKPAIRIPGNTVPMVTQRVLTQPDVLTPKKLTKVTDQKTITKTEKI